MASAVLNPSLRRAFIAGYRVADVEVALAQLRLVVSQLETELATTRGRLAAEEGVVRELRSELNVAQRREISRAETLTALQQEQEDATRHAQAVLEAARVDAAAVRHEAQLQIEGAQRREDQLRHLQERMVGTLRVLASELEAMEVEDVEETEQAEETEAVVATLVATPEPSPVFGRRIELDAGPFIDFASLSKFESALRSLPHVDDVYVRRFEGERATIDLSLGEPAPLLEEMTERLPYSLDVESAVDDRISLTLRAAG